MGVLVLILCVLLFVMCYFFVCYEKELYHTQLTELSTIYPEIKAALADNFGYYQEKMLVALWILGGCVMVTFAIAWCMSFLLGRKVKEKEIQNLNKERDFIYDLLKQYRKGDFETKVIDMDDKDISYRRTRELLSELGDYFQSLKEKLAEEENSTKMLITDISHQLKTPLASLKMSYELSKTTNLTEEERREFFEAEECEIQKLESLLEELVKLSRLESNMIQIKSEKGRIKEVITDAVTQVFMKAHAKDIEIDVQLSDERIEVLYDRKWTVEALANIIDNAIKYSGEGTVIQIRIRSLTTNVLIEVEDEGIGIPEEELHKIFKRFYRGRKAEKYAKDGAGVGLYLARNIIEWQGGTIVAKRKMNKGSIFKITLLLA